MPNADIHHVNNETETLLALVEVSVDQLNQPTNVILGLTELLLAEVENETPLVKDLEIIVKEMRHINEVVKGLKLLTNYHHSSVLPLKQKGVSHIKKPSDLFIAIGLK